LALDLLQTEKSKYPKAKTIDDVGPLTVRIRGALAQLGDANSAAEIGRQAQSSGSCKGERDDDIRAGAINALLQMDWMRKKAVFMLSQHQTSETENLMMEVVRNDPSRDVRQDAVFWLGQIHTQRAEDLLIGIATSDQSIDLRKKALFAMTQQQMPRGQALIRRLAEEPGTPQELRKDAIWQLGQQGSRENSDALRALIMRNKNEEEIAKPAMFSLSQMHGYGNDRWLLNLVTDRSIDEDVRKHAIFCAGQAGISGAELVALYDKIGDRPIKEHLIWVMSDARDRGALDKLLDIAKNDKDVEMRKKALFWLGQKNDPRVRQLLIDIIKGD
jgi:HEAT repeat protein